MVASAIARSVASRGSTVASEEARGGDLPLVERPIVGVWLEGWALSQLSHGLTGQRRNMRSIPDARQNANLRKRTLAHWPDGIDLRNRRSRSRRSELCRLAEVRLAHRIHGGYVRRQSIAFRG